MSNSSKFLVCSEEIFPSSRYRSRYPSEITALVIVGEYDSLDKAKEAMNKKLQGSDNTICYILEKVIKKQKILTLMPVCKETNYQ